MSPPYQIYDDSNLPYVRIVTGKNGENLARKIAESLGCEWKYITKKQAEQLRKEYAEKSKDLRNSAILPAIKD